MEQHNDKSMELSQTIKNILKTARMCPTTVDLM